MLWTLATANFAGLTAGRRSLFCAQVALARMEGSKMSAEDKIKNTAETAKGKVKEAAGKGTGNKSLEAEGRADQAKGDLKNAGEKVKDAFKK